MMNSYVVEEWSKPRPLPNVGVAIPTLSRQEFSEYFMEIDLIWEMTQAQRVTWKNEILNNWDAYRTVLYRDGTDEFHQQLRDMHRMGGALILIGGDMGTGKSIISNTLLRIWNVLKKNKEPAHIFWSKNEVRAKIRKTANNTAHSIDEDMRATGSGSANLEIHLKNLFESIRKTGKLVNHVGVNVQPAKLGRAVAIQIFPIGFNRVFQANRFIVCNWKGEPLWIAITQRFYRPTDPVFYEGELGCLGEYKARALEFSSTQTGVFSGSNAEQELEWRTQLVKHWNADFKGAKPILEMLEFEAIQIGIPQESVASIRRVCASARWFLRREAKGQDDSGSARAEPLEITEGWLGLRELANGLCIKKGLSLRDSTIISHYMVPEEVERTKVEMRRNLKERGLIPQKTRQAAFNAVIKRKLTDKETKIITNTDLGRLGEVFTHRLLRGAIKCHIGHKSSGVCDVSDVKSGDPERAGWALNVKLSLEDEVNRSFQISPEHLVEKSWTLLIMPRLLMMRLYPITSDTMTLNSNIGLCVTLEDLAETIKEMI